jgi:hypothetical protein
VGGRARKGKTGVGDAEEGKGVKQEGGKGDGCHTDVTSVHPVTKLQTPVIISLQSTVTYSFKILYIAVYLQL